MGLKVPGLSSRLGGSETILKISRGLPRVTSLEQNIVLSPLALRKFKSSVPGTGNKGQVCFLFYHGNMIPILQMCNERP